MLVVGIALGLLVIFGALALSSPSSTPPASGPSSQKVPGSTLRALSATGALAPITQPGQPPLNVLDALRVPAGARVLSAQDNHGAQYDEQVRFQVDATQADVITFYRAVLSRPGWRVLSTGSAPRLVGAYQVLARIAGDDAWYWDVGATVEATTFRGASNVTAFTLRLVQVPDPA